MPKKLKFPDDLSMLRSRILSAIAPISPINERTIAEENFLFKAQRTEAGRSLPEYFLCYFLLVDLLGFKNLGKFEKVSWSVPVDYKGLAYLIEYRKLGLGLFAQNAEVQEEDAKVIVKKIIKAVEMAKPFFEWTAQEAARQSALNLLNYHERLFDKFKYFLDQYKEKIGEAEQRSGEKVVTEHRGGGLSISHPSYELRRNAEWLALSAIDSFFSWTEHVFIHIAILNGKVYTGEAVADLANKRWSEKFKFSIGIESEGTKRFYDKLMIIRRQIRNYMAHGAFGKRGEAFEFHSHTGAVPLLLPHQKGSSRFSFYSDPVYDEKKAIDVIEKFIAYLWSGEREPARIYIESGLPLILTAAKDGTYQDAMESAESMEEFVEYLSLQFDQAANMDW